MVDLFQVSRNLSFLCLVIYLFKFCQIYVVLVSLCAIQNKTYSKAFRKLNFSWLIILLFYCSYCESWKPYSQAKCTICHHYGGNLFRIIYSWDFKVPCKSACTHNLQEVLKAYITLLSIIFLYSAFYRINLGLLPTWKPQGSMGVWGGEWVATALPAVVTWPRKWSGRLFHNNGPTTMIALCSAWKPYAVPWKS